MNQNEANGCQQKAIGLGQVPQRTTPVSVREVMDERIQSARKQVERLCIAKAKLEVLQLLDAPYSEIADLLY